jgi:F420-dependent methylenetetrahydromethanopterin dehydrogenase
MTIRLVLHVDVADDAAAVEIHEQLSRQSMGYTLAGHASMVTTERESVDERLDRM